MRCQECNAELDDDVLFCEKCGARISKDNSIASKLHFSKNRPAAAAEGTSGGFYSSTNKGKSTDANNSVVFDAKTIEDDVANIVIDKSEPVQTQQTSMTEEKADTTAKGTEDQQKKEENAGNGENNEGDDDIAGTFTYLAGAAERQINAFLGCAAGALVLLVLAVVTTDFMAILGAGCFGYAFYVTPKVIEATVNALVKGEGYYFIEYVNEISKYMKTAVIPVGAGMALLLVAMILGWCDHDYGAKYVTLLSMFAMAGGFAVSGVCAARFAVTNKIFDELASGNKPKKNYSDVINYVAAGVVFVIVILSAVMAA